MFGVKSIIWAWELRTVLVRRLINAFMMCALGIFDSLSHTGHMNLSIWLSVSRIFNTSLESNQIRHAFHNTTKQCGSSYGLISHEISSHVKAALMLY